MRVAGKIELDAQVGRELRALSKRGRMEAPRFVMHFTPTSASWLNMVERFFRDISENRLRRDSFTSVDELEQAIAQYIEHHNKNPKPFIWTASADDILAKVTRAKAALARVGR